MKWLVWLIPIFIGLIGVVVWSWLLFGNIAKYTGMPKVIETVEFDDEVVEFHQGMTLKPGQSTFVETSIIIPAEPEPEATIEIINTEDFWGTSTNVSEIFIGSESLTIPSDYTGLDIAIQDDKGKEIWRMTKGDNPTEDIIYTLADGYTEADVILSLINIIEERSNWNDTIAHYMSKQTDYLLEQLISCKDNWKETLDLCNEYRGTMKEIENIIEKDDNNK